MHPPSVLQSERGKSQADTPFMHRAGVGIGGKQSHLMLQQMPRDNGCGFTSSHHLTLRGNVAKGQSWRGVRQATPPVKAPKAPGARYIHGVGAELAVINPPSWHQMHQGNPPPGKGTSGGIAGGLSPPAKVHCWCKRRGLAREIWSHPHPRIVPPCWNPC
jgi:hypothetical protein